MGSLNGTLTTGIQKEYFDSGFYWSSYDHFIEKAYLAKFPFILTAIFPSVHPAPSGRQQKLMCLGLYFRFKYLKKPFNLVKQSSTSSLGAQRQLLLSSTRCGVCN